jgi:hypothetical protein
MYQASRAAAAREAAVNMQQATDAATGQSVDGNLPQNGDQVELGCRGRLIPCRTILVQCVAPLRRNPAVGAESGSTTVSCDSVLQVASKTWCYWPVSLSIHQSV